VILRVKAEAGQNPVGLGLDGVTTDLLEPGLGLSVLGQDQLLFRSGCRAQLLAQVLNPVRQDRHLLGTQHHLFKHAASRLCREFLWEVADSKVLRAVHLAGIGLVHADQDLEKGRLPGAVSTNQGDPSARSQLK
jgi:hypothetical protein